MKTAYKITGEDAVRLADRDNLTLHCHKTRLTTGGVVSVDVGRRIAKGDPSLLWVDVQPVWWWDSRRISNLEGYNVSDYFNSEGVYRGPDEDGIEPTWEDAKPA